MEQASLYLKTVFETKVNALASGKIHVLSPGIEIARFEAEPKVAAGVSSPVLIVRT